MATKNYTYVSQLGVALVGGLIGLFGGLTILFVSVWLQTEICPSHACFIFKFSNVYFVIPLMGGILGYFRLRLVKKQGFKRKDELIAMRFCTASIFWAIGNAIFMYVDFVYGQDETFPSLADWIGFVPHSLIWVYALREIYRSAGIRMRANMNLLSSFGLFAPLSLFINFVVMLAVGGFLPSFSKNLSFVENLQKLFLTYFYPFVDAVIVVQLFYLLITKSAEQLLVKVRLPLVVICIGFVAHIFPDLGFNVGKIEGLNPTFTYYSGSLYDWAYAMTLCIISVGVVLYCDSIAQQPANLVASQNAEVVNVESQNPVSSASNSPVSKIAGQVDQDEISIDSRLDVDRWNLYNNLLELFSESEIDDVCFAMKIDEESLKRGTKPIKARELILFCERRSQIRYLVDFCRKQRPRANW